MMKADKVASGDDKSATFVGANAPIGVTNASVSLSEGVTEAMANAMARATAQHRATSAGANDGTDTEANAGPDPLNSAQLGAPSNPTGIMADTAVSTLSSASASATTTRKRVFTFQKRWLHSLPIMEKTIPLSDASFRKLNSGSTNGAADNEAKADSTDGDSTSTTTRDVIVCMLCDEIAVNRELMKVWSRMNCRRGRIENHLMSKHPEFMLLLKHKRETEGDLAVQIYLQSMREGKGKFRNEISANLYNTAMDPATAAVMAANVQPMAAANIELLDKSKRMYGGTGSMTNVSAAAAAAAAAAVMTGSSMQNLNAGNVLANAIAAAAASGAALEPSTAEKTAAEAAVGLHSDSLYVDERSLKKPRLEDIAMATAGAFRAHEPGFLQQRDIVPPSSTADAELFAANESLLSTQAALSFAGRTIMMTGAENPTVAEIAISMWLLGGVVVLTFSEVTTLRNFTASLLLRFPAEYKRKKNSIHPLLLTFKSREEIDRWMKEITDKFARVHLMVASGLRITNDPNSRLSSERLLDLCQSFHGAFFHFSGGCIVHLTSEPTVSDKSSSNESGSSSHTLTSFLASQWLSSGIRVNCISLLTPQTPSSDSLGQNATGSADATQNAALLHAIGFLLSNGWVTGSMLRLQHALMLSAPAPTAQPEEETEADTATVTEDESEPATTSSSNSQVSGVASATMGDSASDLLNPQTINL